MHIFKYKIKKIKDNKGYAILFTIVVVGIISMITMGMTNAVFKQTVLASVAKDSTAAFYQADLASECALMFDNEMDIGERLSSTSYGPTGTFKCADKNLTYNIAKSTTSGFDKYTTDINPILVDFSGTDKCVRMTIIVDESQSPIFTKVDARGYNICDTSKLRTVERSLQVTYGGGAAAVSQSLNTNSGLTITSSSGASISVGSTTQLTSSVSGTIVYTSSETAIATVNSGTGVVTGVVEGTTTITATTTTGEVGTIDITVVGTSTPLIRLLVVGGGGGGGGTTGGGGGGGGVIHKDSVILEAKEYPVLVGNGGMYGKGSMYGLQALFSFASKNGGDSSFNGIIAYGGGGGGGGGLSLDGSNGGSGGGSISGGKPGKSLGGGNDGGVSSAYEPGSGGGGGAVTAGEAGGSNNIGDGGNGGRGYQSPITNKYYGGGGGGGCANIAVGSNYLPGKGIDGGGDGSCTDDPGKDGENGGGGGGGGRQNDYELGGYGGDGVVIISYPTASMSAEGGNVTYSGTNTIHTFIKDGIFKVN